MLHRNLSVSEQKSEYRRGARVSEVRCTLDDLLAEHSSANKLLRKKHIIFGAVRLFFREASKSFPISISREKTQFEYVFHSIGTLIVVIFVTLTYTIIVFYGGYVSLWFVWSILGAIVNPTKMLPLAATIIATVSFIVAKYSSLSNLEKEARDLVQKIVREEFQRLVEKSGVQDMNVPMSQKVLSAVVVGDTDTLASTSLSVDVIHDTIAPLKKQIDGVCNTLGVNEADLRAIASGNEEKITQLALKRMEIDPQLFHLMVSIARNDVVSSKKAFSRICDSIFGEHDDLLVALGTSILETLVSTEKNQVSEVVSKKIITRLLLYTKPKLLAMSNSKHSNELQAFLGHITTDTIFALNSIVHNFSSESLLEMLNLLIRLADDYLFTVFRTKNMHYNTLFRQIGRLCKEFYSQAGQNRSSICGSRVSIEVVIEILNGVLHLCLGKASNSHENKTLVIENLKALCLAMSDVSSSEVHNVINYISSIILNEKGSSRQGNTIVTINKTQQEKMIYDIIQTSIAVIAPNGALDIRKCIDGIVMGITCLPAYKDFVSTRLGELRAHKMLVACNALSAMILPVSDDNLARINKMLQTKAYDMIRQDMEKIVSARNLLKSLADGPDFKVMHNGSPLAHEIRRRGALLISGLSSMKDIGDSRYKKMFQFLSSMCKNNSVVRQQLAMLWTTNIASKKAIEFLDVLVELCIVRRKIIFSVVSDGRDFAENISLKFLDILQSVWSKEENEKWKNMLDPNILRFCNTFMTIESKHLYETFEKTIFLRWKRFSSFVKYVLLCLHQHPVKCDIVISVLKIMMKAFVYPSVAIDFAHETDVPDCQVTYRDLKRVASAYDMSPATLQILYELLFSSIDLVSIESLLKLFGVKKSKIGKLLSLGPKTNSNLLTEEKLYDFLKSLILNNMHEALFVTHSNTTKFLEEEIQVRSLIKCGGLNLGANVEIGDLHHAKVQSDGSLFYKDKKYSVSTWAAKITNDKGIDGWGVVMYKGEKLCTIRTRYIEKGGNIVTTLGLAVISSAHTIGRAACSVVDDADRDSISTLLNTVSIELSNITRKLKPKLLEFGERENGPEWSKKVCFLEWLISSLSALAGMLSSNSQYGNIKVATRLMTLAFPALEKKKKEHVDNDDAENRFENNLDCIKYVIASLISLGRCRLIEGKSLLRQDLGVNGRSLAVSLKKLLQKVSPDRFDDPLRYLNGLIQVSSRLTLENLDNNDPQLKTENTDFKLCFTKTIKKGLSKHFSNTLKENFGVNVSHKAIEKYVLKLKAFDENFVDPSYFLDFLIHIITDGKSPSDDTIATARILCKDIGIRKDKFNLAVGIVSVKKQALTHLYELSKTLKMPSNIVIALVGLVSGSAVHAEMGLKALAERSGFSNLEVVKSFLSFLWGGSFAPMEKFANSLGASELELKLLSLSKQIYYLSQEGREKITYKYLRNLLSAMDHVSGDKGFISLMYLIRQGNINAIKLLVAKDKQDKIWCRREKHNAYLALRGSYIQTLMVVRFSQDARIFVKEMNKLFQDFAPFSFLDEHRMLETDGGKAIVNVLFFESTISELLQAAKIWLDEFIFTDENISFDEVVLNCETYTRRHTKELEDTHNFIFSNPLDPSTLLNTAELSNSNIIEKETKIQYFFAHLAFPLAKHLHMLDIVARRIHIPLRLLVYKFVAGLVQSATGWGSISAYASKKQVDAYDSRNILLERFFEDNTLGEVLERCEQHGTIQNLFMKQHGKVKQITIESPRKSDGDHHGHRFSDGAALKFPSHYKLRTIAKGMKLLGKTEDHVGKETKLYLEVVFDKDSMTSNQTERRLKTDTICEIDKTSKQQIEVSGKGQECCSIFTCTVNLGITSDNKAELRDRSDYKWKFTHFGVEDPIQENGSKEFFNVKIGKYLLSEKFFYFEVVLPKEFKSEAVTAALGFDFQEREEEGGVLCEDKSFYFVSDGSTQMSNVDTKTAQLSMKWDAESTIGAGWDIKRNVIFFAYKSKDGKTEFVRQAFNSFQLRNVHSLIPTFAHCGTCGPIDYHGRKIDSTTEARKNFDLSLYDADGKDMAWRIFPRSIYERTLSGNGKTKCFLHPQQVKQVIRDMLVIMTGFDSDSDLHEESEQYYGNHNKKYRCSMFLGRLYEDGKFANGSLSMYDEDDKSELFWKGSDKRTQFSPKPWCSTQAKQRQYMNNFFQILNPNPADPGLDEQEHPVETENDNDFHGNGWFKNICWNNVSMRHPQSRNDALKDWALAVVWQHLELDVVQDSRLYPGVENRLGFLDFNRYCWDTVAFMKTQMNIDSSDEELDTEMDSIISAKLYRLQAVTQRFPAARAYIIASTMNNFVDTPPWLTANSPLEAKKWYQTLQNSKEDLPNLKGSCYIDHYPPLLYRLLSPSRAKSCNLNQDETQAMNKVLRILLAGDTSVMQSSNAQALRVAKNILDGSKIGNDEARTIARALSLPYLNFENFVGLVRGSSWHLKRFCRSARIKEGSARAILDDSARMVLKSGMDIFEAYDKVFFVSLGYPKELKHAKLSGKIRKYETLFAMALIKGYPPAVHLAADIIFQPGMQNFAAQTRKLICEQNSDVNISRIDKYLTKCLRESRTMYKTFLTIAIQRGAGISSDIGTKFVDIILSCDAETGKGYFLLNDKDLFTEWITRYLHNVTNVLRGNVHRFDMFDVFHIVHVAVEDKIWQNIKWPAKESMLSIACVKLVSYKMSNSSFL